MNLQELLIDFSAVPDAELAAKGYAAYKQHYLQQEKFGILNAHDGAVVVFHEDRFRHAFYDKPDKWSLTKSHQCQNSLEMSPY